MKDVSVPKLFEGIFEASKDAIGYAALDGTILLVNRALSELTGFSEEELLRMNARDLIPEQHKAQRDRVVAQVLLTSKPIEYEIDYLRKNGSQVPVSVTLSAVKGDDQKPTGLMAIIRDLTERKQTEEQFRLVVEASPNGLLMVDENGTILLVNRQIEQQFGYERDELIGQSVERLVPQHMRSRHTVDRTKFYAHSESRAMGKGRDLHGVRKDGQEFPLEIGLNPIRTPDGMRVLASVVDISERKQAEEALRESQRQLTTLISNLPGYVYRCLNDRNRTLQYISEGVVDLAGYTVDEYLSQKVMTFGEQTHPEDSAHVWQEVQSALEHHRPFEMTYRILTKSGEVKWVWERGEGIYTSDGSLSYLEGFVTEVTDRKRAERLLRQSEERYRRLIAVSPYAILVNRGDRIIFANDQAIKLFGAVKAEEILGKSPLDLFHPDYHTVIRERIHELLEGNAQVPMLEEKIVTLGGRSVDVEASAARFVDEEGPAILVMLRDVSEQKRLQEQLRKTERIAELGTLASGMAHEIGTPMNVILGRAEYLMDRVTEEPVRKGLQTIITQVERITRVMNQLLAFARRKLPERTPVVLKEIVEDSLELFRERFGKSRVTVELSLDDDCPKVLADPDQMSQVFINLVMNAVYAMPDGGTLRIDLAPEEQMVKLTVADTGHGIPRDVVKRIFEPFFTTKEFGQGTGLGLTVVKGIIEEHQGVIEVESEEGKGTTFMILLPRADSD